jgi:hypothetical protein
VSASADYAAHNVIIHYSTVFDGRTPARCGATGTPCPASDEWRYVTCARCLAIAPPVIHARRNVTAVALCEAAPGEGRWTTKRNEVTCGACFDEIARRRLRQ